MTDMVGSWVLESSDNFEEYLRATGLGLMKRKLASRLTPTNTISVEGDVWTMEVKMGWKTISHSFKLGEQFEENTPAGNFKTTVSVDGPRRLTQTQVSSAGKTATFIRELQEDGKIYCTLECNGVKATRTFVRT